MKREFELFATAGTTHPCCVPSRQRAALLGVPGNALNRVTSGSTEEMIKLDGGAFLMGTNSAEGFPADGEGPVREITLDPFYIDAAPVTNAQFAEFTRASGYRDRSRAIRMVLRFSGSHSGRAPRGAGE